MIEQAIEAARVIMLALAPLNPRVRTAVLAFVYALLECSPHDIDTFFKRSKP